MKKSLLVSFLCALTLNITAQSLVVPKVATFDFHHPETLTPAVDFGNESVCDINKVNFVDREVSFQAQRTWKSFTPVINQNIKPDWCGLQIPSFSAIVVSVPEGCQLLEIDMCSMGYYDGTGGIKMDSSTPLGTIYFGLWKAYNDNDTIHGIQTMKFVNEAGHDGVVSGVKVTYLAPIDVLEYVNFSPAADAETDPFTGYEITFASNVTVNTDTTYLVTDADNQIVASLTPAVVNGKKVTLTPDKPITKAGSYKLVIPAGTIAATNGDVNKEWSFTFSVKDYPDTFIYSDINQPTGMVKELPAELVLTFPSQIGELVDVDGLKFTSNDGSRTKDVVFTVPAEDSTKLVLTLSEPVINRDTLTLSIPESSILAKDGFHYNPAFSLVYYIMAYDVPSEELVAQADSLLQLTGVGYPKTSSIERLALKEVVEGKDKSKQDYEDAIAAYLNTTDVVLPSYGSYYILTKMAKADSDQMSYLGYDGDFYVSAEEDAEHFLFVDVEGDRYIQMSDSTKKAVTLSKTVVAGDSLATFGLLDVVIDGFNDEIAGLGYHMTLTKSRDPKNMAVFAPVSGTLTDEMPELTITISQTQNITYHADKPIRLMLGEQVVKTITNPVVNGNKLTLQLGLEGTEAIDNYTVDIPKGAITYYSIDHEVEVPAMTADYGISKSYGFGSFLSTYSIFNLLSEDDYYAPEQLNDAAIMSTETDLFLNPESCVTRVLKSDGTTLFLGTLEKDAESSISTNQQSVLKFKFNVVFDRDNLPDGQYKFVIEKGSFGDSNYGQYLLDPTSLAKHDCYVLSGNGLVFNYKVDYDIATGISAVEAGAADNDIYDLSGRRVHASKPGLYIRDGRKVLVK